MPELYLYFPGRTVVCSADDAVVHELIRAIREGTAGLRTLVVWRYQSIPALDGAIEPHRLTVDVSQVLAWSMVETLHQEGDATGVRRVGHR
jgi:hypothetical protein